MQPNPKFSDSLEGLLADAMQQARRRKVTNKAIAKPVPPKEPFRSTFQNPENWRPGKVLAVIHRSAEGKLTLLGAFREYVHMKVEGSRKLCRISEPVPIEGEHFVTGDNWLSPHAAILPPSEDNPEGIEDRELQFDLEIPCLQIIAKQAKIRVRLEKGWIRSVKLARQTQFVCLASKIFIFFPPNLDVLEEMGFDNKVALKKRLETK